MKCPLCKTTNCDLHKQYFCYKCLDCGTIFGAF